MVVRVGGAAQRTADQLGNLQVGASSTALNLLPKTGRIYIAVQCFSQSAGTRATEHLVGGTDLVEFG